MKDLVLQVPDQLRWGVDVAIPDVAAADHIVLLGMGGSAMAARVGALIAAAGPTVVEVRQGYDLPAWAATQRPLVVAVSYSGSTEETLSGFGAAIDLGLPVAAVSSGGAVSELVADVGGAHVAVPGGMQPRAALGFQVGAVLRVLEGAGAVSDVPGSLTAAADVVEMSLGGGSGAGWALGADLADALRNRIPIIVGGSGPGALAAGRWMTQINENTKRAAFALEAPELNHNALEAWATPGREPGPMGVIALRDGGGHPRNERRLDLTVERLGERIPLVGEVSAVGEGLLERIWSLMVVGDVASVVLADHLGVDAMPVDVLQDFKIALRED